MNLGGRQFSLFKYIFLPSFSRIRQTDFYMQINTNRRTNWRTDWNLISPFRDYRSGDNSNSYLITPRNDLVRKKIIIPYEVLRFSRFIKYIYLFWLQRLDEMYGIYQNWLNTVSLVCLDQFRKLSFDKATVSDGQNMIFSFGFFSRTKIIPAYSG